LKERALSKEIATKIARELKGFQLEKRSRELLLEPSVENVSCKIKLCFLLLV